MSVAHGASAADEIFRVHVIEQHKKRRFNRTPIHLQKREKEKEEVKGLLTYINQLITYINQFSLHLKILFIEIPPYFAVNNISYDVSLHYLLSGGRGAFQCI